LDIKPKLEHTRTIYTENWIGNGNEIISWTEIRIWNPIMARELN